MKIDSVKIKNFKSLKDVDIKLNNLTLITGINSSGKSSFIQSLLFFKQNVNDILFAVLNTAFNKIGYSPKVRANFNGEYLNLGNTNLLLSQESLGKEIIFEINCKKEKVKIAINDKLEISCNKGFSHETLDMFGDDKFNYLNTDRVQPKNTFDFSQNEIDNHSIGLNGEYTAHYLAENRHKSLNVQALKHSDSQTLQLLENTYKWLGEISHGISISVHADASTQNVKLTYQYEYGNNTTSDYSPLNVGFGLTYVLPVIVLILKSKPGDFIIIENPESHLHPAGQSKIAEMCAIAANNGVQIIVETHSDHFLNGVRVATKNGIIAPDKSQVYFFEKEKNGLDTIPRPINIDKDGKLNDWPKSFFDEWDNQLDKLLW
jgi:predicted ATPase